MGIFELATACRLRARSRRGAVLCHCVEANAIATVCDRGKTAFRFNERG